jgi:DNA-binding CsgD family transcriptional regulator
MKTQSSNVEKDLLVSKASRYRSIFYDSPIALREEDWSGVRAFMKGLPGKRAADFRVYIEDHPEAVSKCLGKIKIHSVNNASFKMYQVKDIQEFLMNFEKLTSVVESRATYRALLVAMAEGHGKFEGEVVNRTMSGEQKILNMWSVVVPGYEKTLERVIVGLVDITERKKAEDELRIQKAALEQKNSALKEILEQIEVEKKHIKDDVVANVEEVLLPALDMLKMKGASQKYVDVLKENLKALTSSFGRTISDKKLRLTPKEIEICNMIKEGLSSKDIATMKNISLQTIHKHRNNIRKKLSLLKKKRNLTSYLQTI